MEFFLYTMIIVNSRLLHQLHSLSVAHTHTIYFSLHAYTFMVGDFLAKNCIRSAIIICTFFPFLLVLSFTLVVKDTCTVIVSLCLSADFIFYSCDQLKWSDRWYDTTLLWFYAVIILLCHYYFIITLWYYCLLLWLASYIYDIYTDVTIY
jgi:hypothetical protein